MPTLLDIKSRIGSVEKIKKIANALQVVALTRLRRIEEKTEKARRYFDSIRTLTFDISNNLIYEAHPFFRMRNEIKKSMVIALTSDRGLCGDFNTNVERELKAFLSEKSASEVTAISIGRKGKYFLRRKGTSLKKEYDSSLKNIDYLAVGSEIMKTLVDMFLGKEVDEVIIIYNEFKRQFLGRPKRLQILPFKAEGFSIKRVKDYIYEPTPYQVLDGLLKEYIASQIGQAVLESNAAEELARMLAMKQARDNADEAIGILRLDYHKLRQTRITRELIDIAIAANM